MKFLLSLASAAAVALTGCAQDKPKPPELKIGSPAPTLKADSWMAGTEVKAFEANKVYVVEFWATWCGPCIASMPHLSDLQKEYKDKGLVIVGVTTKDDNNTKDKVTAFVEKKGKKYGYVFAYCDTDAMDTAYMQASGQQGIPCSFVVDKAGKIAFIGHPMQLDDVLPKVLDGTWKGEADIKAMEETEKEINKAFESLNKDAAAGLRAVAEIETKYPAKAKQPMFQLQKTVGLMRGKKLDEAKAISETLLKASAEKGDASMLGNIAAVWTAEQLNPDKKHQDLAVKAAEALLKADEEDWQNLITAAEVFHATGDNKKAAELCTKAIAKADHPEVKKQLEKMLSTYKK
jgi:thiol-disulfide isomerase/thioredoxin